ncbi:Galactose mutarotase-like superfamily protein [Prunus dulcis]|uniref:glucose-6-phosphate 1-epimerase n=1 Tax=Prunus dulcis TaxID=3755 RepID=A0A4Y1R0I6_PRUDU|nr:Galactose mutarotase-like superfamily protein [Prunus dulcis]
MKALAFWGYLEVEFSGSENGTLAPFNPSLPVSFVLERFAADWDYRAAIEITKDWNGVEQVLLQNQQGASARVSLHGGQVTSWRNKHGEELLFTSSKAIFKPPKAMRGGIPICFPQFGNCGSLEQHGFARNKVWAIDDDPQLHPPNDSHGKSFIDLLLKPSEDDLKCWPHSFEFRLRVSLATSGDLTLTSRVRNVNGKPFSFSFAYHTYFLVSDISEVRIEGLETLDYLDNLCERKRFTEQGDAITFESEETLELENHTLVNKMSSTAAHDFVGQEMPWLIDKKTFSRQVSRLYLSSPNVIAVLDHEKKRTYVIRKEGLPDVSVWNPWEKKSKSMVDFGDEEYKQMLCVDGAAIEKPVTLKPGEEWTGRLQLSVVPSSFCSEHLDL